MTDDISINTQDDSIIPGGDGKYGRLFTEDDVIAFAHEMTQENAGMDRGMSEDRVRSELAEFEGKFPKDEPLFLLRGKDKVAAETIEEYRFLSRENGSPDEQVLSVIKAKDAFAEFARENPERMKVAD